MSTISVGIDPGLVNLVVCFDGGVDGPAYDHFTSDAVGSLLDNRIERYQSLSGRLIDSLLPMSIGTIVLEGYSFASKSNSGIWSAEFGGILRFRLLESGFAVVEVTPGQLKKWATGKGTGDKVAIATSLTKRYNEAFESGDHADAFAAMMIARQLDRSIDADIGPIFQQEVIDGLRSKTPA